MSKPGMRDALYTSSRGRLDSYSLKATTELTQALEAAPASTTIPHQRTQTSMSQHELEHGHSPFHIHPMTHHSPESVSAWFNGFFTTVIGISTLGASITFNYILSSPASPNPKGHFNVGHIQLFLGISWLLFLLALAFASLGSTILTFFKDHWKKDWNGEHGVKSQRDVQLYATFTTAVLGALVIAAFLFLCLVVTAYSPIVGWVALGFTSLFGVVILIGVMFQFPWPCQRNTPTKVKEGGDNLKPEDAASA